MFCSLCSMCLISTASKSEYFEQIGYFSPDVSSLNKLSVWSQCRKKTRCAIANVYHGRHMQKGKREEMSVFRCSNINTFHMTTGILTNNITGVHNSFEQIVYLMGRQWCICHTFYPFILDICEAFVARLRRHDPRTGNQMQLLFATQSACVAS